jgi:hypothetical protein
MYIEGTQEERGCEGQGCHDCPYQAIGVGELACELEHGTLYVRHAGDLWSLVDTERARKIRNWLEDEWSAGPNGDLDIRCYGSGSCRYLVNLIDGLVEALQNGPADDTLRLSPEAADRIRMQYFYLVDSWVEEATEVHTLANRVQEVSLLQALLEKALEYDRAICVG